MTTTMGVKLDEEMRERLKVVGAALRRTPHWLMREAISQYLTREEDKLRKAQETLESWEHYKATGLHVTHEDMAAWLSTWGTDKEGLCPKSRT
ncbi:MAG: CopG family ribbon-helix-helix protein [Bdellovibrionales bacterium]